MVVIFHNHYSITKIQCDGLIFNSLVGQPILNGIKELVTKDFEGFVVWCNEKFSNHLNYDSFKTLDLQSTFIYSFNPNINDFFNRVIGYVDLSPAVKINYKNTYPTWLMSSQVGVADVHLLKLAINEIDTNSDFDYFLKSFAKLSQSKGVLCYSEPILLGNFMEEKNTKSSDEVFKLIRFTKQHFKLGWLIILLKSLLFQEHIYSFFTFLKSLFFKRRTFKSQIIHESIKKQLTVGVYENKIDVLIPTIGREKYLYDVLCDLKKQTLLPKRIIIIEQNPDLSSTSSLDYLTNETWPFAIIHTFTHQAGACNARNLGLDLITNDLVFFADDDIRIQPDFIAQSIHQMTALNCKAATFKCTGMNDISSVEKNPFQWGGFGAGSSIVKKSAIAGCRFGMGYEFGFGEDSDFGMQIRNNGTDVLFFEQPSLIHLKAPVGGFRTKPVVAWADEKYAPKPSPTVMLYRIKHCSTAQNITYKLKLFLSYYRLQTIKSPITYYKVFQHQWQVSLKWATILLEKNEL